MQSGSSEADKKLETYARALMWWEVYGPEEWAGMNGEREWPDNR